MLSVWRPGRFLALLLLLYVAADLMDPFTPGMFSFEKDTFFVDGAVQLKSHASTAPAPLTSITSSADTAVADDELAAVKVCAAARLYTPHRLRRTNQKHHGFSLAITSPPDSEPELPLS